MLNPMKPAERWYLEESSGVVAYLMRIALDHNADVAWEFVYFDTHEYHIKRGLGEVPKFVRLPENHPMPPSVLDFREAIDVLSHRVPFPKKPRISSQKLQ